MNTPSSGKHRKGQDQDAILQDGWRAIRASEEENGILYLLGRGAAAARSAAGGPVRPRPPDCPGPEGGVGCAECTAVSPWCLPGPHLHR